MTICTTTTIWNMQNLWRFSVETPIQQWQIVPTKPQRIKRNLLFRIRMAFFSLFFFHFFSANCIHFALYSEQVARFDSVVFFFSSEMNNNNNNNFSSIQLHICVLDFACACDIFELRCELIFIFCCNVNFMQRLAFNVFTWTILC